MVMTDYKSCIMALNRAGILMVVGEMKVFWVNEHDLLLGRIKKNASWKQFWGKWSLETFPMIILANISFGAGRQIYEGRGSSLRLIIELQPDSVPETELS